MVSSPFLLSATATVTLLCMLTNCLPCTAFESFKSATIIWNAAQDHRTGRVYIGAPNNIYQLNANLELEKHVKHSPSDEENMNLLLLVYPNGGSLIVCGTAYDGTCSLLNLTAISDKFCCGMSKDDETRVARDHPLMVIPGIVARVHLKRRQLDVLIVTKKVKTFSERTYFLSVHRLQRDGQGTEVFGSVAKLTSRNMQRFDHEGFRMFQDGDFVYTIFSRLTQKGNDLSERSLFVSRFCVNDIDFYSYTEVPLTCGEQNSVTAATMAPAGRVLAEQLHIGPDDQVLFGVFHQMYNNLDSLCLYSLKSINQAVERIRTTCYKNQGMVEGTQLVYQPYSEGRGNPCHSVVSLLCMCA